MPVASRGCGSTLYIAIAIAVVVIGAVVGIVVWQLSGSTDDSSGSLSAGPPRGTNESVVVDGSIVLQGLEENEFTPDSEAARHFCEGVEQAAGLPAGSCQVLGVAPTSLEDSGLDQGTTGEGAADPNAPEPLEVTFALRLGPSFMPEEPEAAVAATVEQALQEAAESGGLLGALRDAGGEESPLGSALTGVGKVEAKAVPGAPSPTPSSTPSASPTPSVSPSPAPYAAPVPGGQPQMLPLPGHSSREAILLARSSPGQLIRMFRTPRGSDPTSGTTPQAPVPAGRSYDGRDWEPQPPLMASFNCSPAVDPRGLGLCSVVFPEDAASGTASSESRRRALQDGAEGGGVAYWVQSTAVLSPDQVPHEVRAARFLQAATFGTTRAELDAFPTPGPNPTPNPTEEFARTASGWVYDQMHEVPPTLHRAYYRKRANPRNLRPIDSGGVRGPCQAESRWRRFALSIDDQG